MIRFIPARAGIGVEVDEWEKPIAVHPRPCGDRPPGPAMTRCSNGSSPPVRGSGGNALRKNWLSRFIPARAGIGPPATLAKIPTAVHPRPCGDRVVARMADHDGGGSSPPVRGSGASSSHGRARSWFIPARAGIGGSPGNRSRLVPVHPRPCGDRISSSCSRSFLIGSSPPVRGSDFL